MDKIWEGNCNITLDFHSTSAKNGHFGSSTDYIAEEHRVVRRTWGARRRFYDLLPPKVIPPTAEYMDIPEDITTEEAIRDYIHYHRGQWVPMPQEIAHQPRKHTAQQWLRFAFTLLTCGLWLLFVTDYWNNATAYTTFFPFHRYELIRYSNASYLISAGLPVAAFFLLSVLPDALKKIFPGYHPWNRCYTAVAALLITLQTALMLASTKFYVKIGVADLLFGYHYHLALREMTEYYVLSVPVLLSLSALVWLLGTAVSLLRMRRPVRRLTYRRTAETFLWCIVLTLILAVGSIMILNVLFAMNFRAAAYVTSHATQVTFSWKSAMISLLSAPIVEEIAFRGIICKWLKKTSKAWIAIVISAVFFGLWHRNLGQFAYTFAWGILLGFVSLRSGSVLWPMLIHFTCNLLSILAHSNSSAGIFGAWPTFVSIRVWIQQWPMWATILSLVVMVIMSLFICLRIKRINR